MGLQSATMNDIACWLRAQIPSSIDPARLERLAREAERQAVLRGGIATMVRERSPSKPFVSSDSGTKASVVSLGRPQGRSDDVVPASSMPRDGN